MPSPDAARVLAAAAAKGLSVAVAESLTGGSLVAALTEVPGASATVRGGVVAYHADVKRDVLGVAAELLAAQGPVSDDVALAMADGVRVLLGATVGVATTGVAGPDAHGGQAPGRVHIAAVTEGVRLVRHYELAGNRLSVISQACTAALELLEELVSLRPHAGRRGGEQL